MSNSHTHVESAMTRLRSARHLQGETQELAYQLGLTKTDPVLIARAINGFRAARQRRNAKSKLRETDRNSVDPPRKDERPAAVPKARKGGRASRERRDLKRREKWLSDKQAAAEAAERDAAAQAAQHHQQQQAAAPAAQKQQHAAAQAALPNAAAQAALPNAAAQAAPKQQKIDTAAAQAAAKSAKLAALRKMQARSHETLAQFDRLMAEEQRPWASELVAPATPKAAPRPPPLPSLSASKRLAAASASPPKWDPIQRAVLLELQGAWKNCLVARSVNAGAKPDVIVAPHGMDLGSFVVVSAMVGWRLAITLGKRSSRRVLQIEFTQDMVGHRLQRVVDHLLAYHYS